MSAMQLSRHQRVLVAACSAGRWLYAGQPVWCRPRKPGCLEVLRLVVRVVRGVGQVAHLTLRCLLLV